MVVTLSVSGRGLRSDCGDVVEMMRQSGICGDVTCNATVLDGAIEPGCRINVVTRGGAERLWGLLQRSANLTCAHVRTTSDDPSGCVLDVFRPSLCPGKKGEACP